VGVNRTDFFHIMQLAVAETEKQGSGHIVLITTSLGDQAVAGVPAVLATLIPFYEDGAFQAPVIDRAIPLSEGCPAHAQVARGEARDRLVLAP
jgi:NADPH:quinone reductase-like Zn-dependent oxidoreductase